MKIITRLIIAAALVAGTARAGRVIGNLNDLTTSTYSPRVTFVPLSTPLAYQSTNTVLDVPRWVTPTNGLFAATLVGGLYRVEFSPPNDPILILMPPDTTNTYQFNELAALATNVGTFSFNTNMLSFISQRVRPAAGSETSFTTNNPGAIDESLTISVGTANALTNLHSVTVNLNSNLTARASMVVTSEVPASPAFLGLNSVGAGGYGSIVWNGSWTFSGSGGLTANQFVGSGAGLTAINASAINSGTVAPARLGTGSGGAAKFLREDSTWQTVTAGTSNDWVGSFTGNGSGLTNLPASAIASGVIDPERLGDGTPGDGKFLSSTGWVYGVETGWNVLPDGSWSNSVSGVYITTNGHIYATSYHGGGIVPTRPTVAPVPTVTVTTAEQLIAAVTNVAPAVIRIAEGSYDVGTNNLVWNDGVHVVGDGSHKTTITGYADCWGRESFSLYQVSGGPQYSPGNNSYHAGLSIVCDTNKMLAAFNAFTNSGMWSGFGMSSKNPPAHKAFTNVFARDIWVRRGSWDGFHFNSSNRFEIWLESCGVETEGLCYSIESGTASHTNNSVVVLNNCVGISRGRVPQVLRDSIAYADPQWIVADTRTFVFNSAFYLTTNGVAANVALPGTVRQTGTEAAGKVILQDCSLNNDAGDPENTFTNLIGSFTYNGTRYIRPPNTDGGYTNANFALWGVGFGGATNVNGTDVSLLVRSNTLASGAITNSGYIQSANFQVGTSIEQLNAYTLGASASTWRTAGAFRFTIDPANGIKLASPVKFGWSESDNSTAALETYLTRAASGVIGASGAFAATNGFSSRSNRFMLMPTNSASANDVVTATGVEGGNTVHTKWAAGGAGGSQTPWTSDINAAGYDLTNLHELRMSNLVIQKPGANNSGYVSSVVDLLGGTFNTISGSAGAANNTVLGGYSNTFNVTVGTVTGNLLLGGSSNTVQNTASANFRNSVVLGGAFNVIDSAANSVVGGQRAYSGLDGTFVWSDGSAGSFAAQVANSAIFRVGGGFGINTNHARGNSLSVLGTTLLNGDTVVASNLTVIGNIASSGSGRSIAMSGTAGFGTNGVSWPTNQFQVSTPTKSKALAVDTNGNTFLEGALHGPSPGLQLGNGLGGGNVTVDTSDFRSTTAAAMSLGRGNIPWNNAYFAGEMKSTNRTVANTYATMDGSRTTAGTVFGYTTNGVPMFSHNTDGLFTNNGPVGISGALTVSGNATIGTSGGSSGAAFLLQPNGAGTSTQSATNYMQSATGSSSTSRLIFAGNEGALGGVWNFGAISGYRGNFGGSSANGGIMLNDQASGSSYGSIGWSRANNTSPGAYFIPFADGVVIFSNKIAASSLAQLILGILQSTNVNVANTALTMDGSRTTAGNVIEYKTNNAVVFYVTTRGDIYGQDVVLPQLTSIPTNAIIAGATNATLLNLAGVGPALISTNTGVPGGGFSTNALGGVEDVIYVNGVTGNDSGTGTKLNPLLTIEQATTNSVAGRWTRIEVAPGTYYTTNGIFLKVGNWLWGYGVTVVNLATNASTLKQFGIVSRENTLVQGVYTTNYWKDSFFQLAFGYHHGLNWGWLTNAGWIDCKARGDSDAWFARVSNNASTYKINCDFEAKWDADVWVKENVANAVTINDYSRGGRKVISAGSTFNPSYTYTHAYGLSSQGGGAMIGNFVLEDVFVASTNNNYNQAIKFDGTATDVINGTLRNVTVVGDSDMLAGTTGLGDVQFNGCILTNVAGRFTNVLSDYVDSFLGDPYTTFSFNGCLWADSTSNLTHVVYGNTTGLKGGFGTNDAAVFATKIIGTGADGKYVPAALNGLTWDGATLTATNIITKSNTWPIAAIGGWAALGNVGCVDWISNNVVYKICTNSISGTGSTNLILVIP